MMNGILSYAVFRIIFEIIEDTGIAIEDALIQKGFTNVRAQASPYGFFVPSCYFSELVNKYPDLMDAIMKAQNCNLTTIVDRFLELPDIATGPLDRQFMSSDDPKLGARQNCRQIRGE